MCEWCTEMKATRSCTYPNDGGSGWTVVRGCRVHRLIARRARRLGSRQTSHLVDVERRRCCKDSVHSSGSFCTKLRLLALRTPPSWLAAGAPGRMPAARRPEMHHASLCAGTYPQGLRDANGLAVGRCGEEASAGFLLRGKQNGIQWSIRPLSIMFSSIMTNISEDSYDWTRCKQRPNGTRGLGVGQLGVRGL